MATAGRRAGTTPEAYLTGERRAATRHEYWDGEVVAMPGASRQHNLITLNLGAELRAQLRDRAGEVYAADMRVCVEPDGLYVYPDLVVVDGEPRFLDDEFDTLLNPTVLVEVLSPSTEAVDRGDKSTRYRRLASLREYVLIAQDRIRVERHIRDGAGWRFEESRHADDVLRLDAIGCAVPLREIYAKVRFPGGVAAGGG